MFGKKKLYGIEYTYLGTRYHEMTYSRSEATALKKLRKLITRNHGYAAVYINYFGEIKE